jgi:hypothetical protein
LGWEPETIQAGNETRFLVEVMDDTQFPLDRVSYDFKVLNSNSTAVLDLKNQFAEDGTAVHPVKFNETGPAKVQVVVKGTQGVNAGEFVENSEFNIGVVP